MGIIIPIMSETEGYISEPLRKLPDSITRSLLITTGRNGLQQRGFDGWIAQNQTPFRPEADDYYLAMVAAHQGSMVIPTDARILGIREEVTRRCMVIEDGTETEFVEASPIARNIWVGDKHVRLLTPDEAAKIDYSSQTALKWATINGVVPEMVVKANNGYFYPATKNDIVISPQKSS